MAFFISADTDTINIIGDFFHKNVVRKELWFFSYLNTCDLDITFHFSIHRLLNWNLGHSKILFSSIASYSYHFHLSVSYRYRNLYRPIPIRHFSYWQKWYIGRYRYCIGRTMDLYDLLYIKNVGNPLKNLWYRFN